MVFSAEGKDLLENNTFESSVSALPRLLRSAVIYGPNAGGKSNFVRAMDFVRKFVISSAKELQEGEGIAATPFLFNQLGPTQPSEFEVQFIQEGIRYQYGFAVTRERVTNEWLIAYPEGRAQRWFDRAIQWNSEQLKPVFTWFQRLFVIGPSTLLTPTYSISACQDDAKKKHILVKYIFQ